MNIVYWDDLINSYGVFQNNHDFRDYYIHQPMVVDRYKWLLDKGNIVTFALCDDKLRNRDRAINVRFLTFRTLCSYV